MTSFFDPIPPPPETPTYLWTRLTLKRRETILTNNPPRLVVRLARLSRARPWAVDVPNVGPLVYFETEKEANAWATWAVDTLTIAPG